MTIPAIPNAGTLDPAPLVTIADYQFVTKDTESIESDFDQALLDALDFLQRRLKRTLRYGQYTERLFLYSNGQVYPTAYPLDSTKAVVAPGGAENQAVGIFQGIGVWVGWFIPLPSLPVWQGVVPPQTDITYWGGYVGSTSDRWDTGPWNLPAALKRIICELCWFQLNPAMLTGRPGGVTGSSIGGVSLSGDLSSFVEADTDLKRRVHGYRHPMVRAFDGQTT